MFEMFCSRPARRGAVLAALLLFTLAAAPMLAAELPQAATDVAVQQDAPRHAGGEANLVLPDLGQVDFQGINGRTLLMGGLGVCLLGLAFGLVIFRQLRDLPVHRSMLEISELIYETCKTYLITQGKFLAILWVFIAAIMVWYFSREMAAFKIGVIVVFSIVGILGSYSVAWFGIRMNTYANSRTAFAGLKGKPYPTMEIPLKA